MLRNFSLAGITPARVGCYALTVLGLLVSSPAADAQILRKPCPPKKCVPQQCKPYYCPDDSSLTTQQQADDLMAVPPSKPQPKDPIRLNPPPDKLELPNVEDPGEASIFDDSDPTVNTDPAPVLAPTQFAALGGSTIALADTSTAYIDLAIPRTYFRLRYDSAFNNTRPNRAEFFYARGAPLGPGLGLLERSIDYQELMAYMEIAPLRDLSFFAELGTRFLDPEVNSNTAGLTDMNAGVKFAMIQKPDFVFSAQLKTYIPTGDADRGLGNDHVSLEPGLLMFSKPSEDLTFSAELRYWIPIDGTDDFAGDILRYGIGTGYTLWDNCCTKQKLTAVLEVVGWTVLDGQETIVSPGGAANNIDATGITIVNIKPGVRYSFNQKSDIYAGYGRAVTGPSWYEDLFRIEYRRSF